MPRNKKNKDSNGDKKDNVSKDSEGKLPVISKSDKILVEELLRSAFNEYAHKFETKRIERAETAKRLTAFISEYLSAFMIIGYDMQGLPINIIHASNQMDADALSSALNKFIFNLNNSDD